ncbi:Pkinase domain-containing protein [Cephalotus follicularis]|uniref:non-specific serine/threonine protein kinase n=1 Tax=Cephalotus follicularis TaxID=3775 RepID=A0A1Q3B1D5_CEPFO|nr:Pkinase domain-containing protein [Cephalotus follicularis]
MAVAKSNSNNKSSTETCHCYRVPNLNQIILDTKQISNLKDRYVLGEQLGWGQFGVIRTCSDKLTGELLACKSIAKDRLVTLDDARSVKLEIEVMTRLSGHPNVVDLKAVYEDYDYVHLVMELCAGGELFHQLEKYGKYSEAEARTIFRHLMQVILYCHETGVVHRDLKPENILFATKAPSSPIKLADFGLATYIKPGESLHGTVGSPFYIAPEVLAGAYNHSADVWSAGVILYILLSGMPPFWGNTKSRIFDAVRTADLRFPSDPWDRISESAKNLVRGMLCTDPSRRLTANQVLEHLWIRDDGLCPEEPRGLIIEECDLGGGASFPTSFMSRNKDISFGIGTPIISDVPSPTYTCRTSLSSFGVGPSTRGFASGGFSFGSSGNSDTLEFSSPVPSLPSFAFLTPNSVVEQESSTMLHFSNNISSIGAAGEERNLDELLTLPDSSYVDESREERKTAEIKRAGATIGSMILGIHSKRNRTIGVGEREPLNLMVSESVIRWASCTHLPSAPSLRSSLVC